MQKQCFGWVGLSESPEGPFEKEIPYMSYTDPSYTITRDSGCNTLRPQIWSVISSFNHEVVFLVS